MKAKRYSLGNEDRKLNNEIIDEYQYSINKTVLTGHTPEIESPGNSSVVNDEVIIKVNEYFDDSFSALAVQYNLFHNAQLICDSLLNYVDIYKDTEFPNYEPIDWFVAKVII